MDAIEYIGESPDLDLAAARTRLAKCLAPPRLDIASQVHAAAADGLSPRRLFREVTRVMRGPGRLTLAEYFYYRLYDLTLPRDEVERYVGKGSQARFHIACNDVRWFAVAQDKALFYAAAAGAGWPVPHTQAVYAPGVRQFTAEAIRTPESLSQFLREPSHYPLFAKPVDGIFSIGALSLAALEGNRICFTTGEIADVDAVVSFVSGFGGEGFLLQDRVEPHPALRAAFGSTLPTIRFLVLLSPDAITVESTVLKIPSWPNPADNYWRSGNMLGALDASGVVQRVVTGVGSELREQTVHPNTGSPLIGLAVPDWERSQELCIRAASMFPGIRTQSWDVALTETGPVMLELNFGGDLNLHQLAHRRGALTPSYIAHLERCGYRRLKKSAT